MQPPLAPPVWAALNLPPVTPPAISSNSRRVVPSGTSRTPTVAMSPEIEKTLVPLLPGVPIELNQAAPLTMIGAMQPKVSTLLIRVELPHRPRWAG